jgi:hypothetical protein
MFGPRTTTDPLYDTTLRPKNAEEMAQRIVAFTLCKERWHYLARRGPAIGSPIEPNTNPAIREQPHVAPIIENCSLNPGANLFDYHWAWGIATNGQSNTSKTPSSQSVPDLDPAYTLPQSTNFFLSNVIITLISIVKLISVPG